MKISPIADLEYLDRLPKAIKQALWEAPKPFSAKFAWDMLQAGMSAEEIVQGLNAAIRAEISDGQMPSQTFKPLRKQNAGSPRDLGSRRAAIRARVGAGDG